MNRAPCVVHFKCLDTIGLRDAARAIGAGKAGVRLTRKGLAIYTRDSKRVAAPAVVADTVASVAPEPVAPAIAPEPALATQALPAAPPPEPERETLAPYVATVEPRPAAPSLVTIELGLRRPTIWAVAFLTIGVTFGAAIARAVTAAAPTSLAAASAPLAAIDGALPVAWPQTTRATPPSAAPPSSLVPLVPLAPARAHHSSHAQRRASPATSDGVAPASETLATDTIESDSAEAARSADRARKALIDAL